MSHMVCHYCDNVCIFVLSCLKWLLISVLCVLACGNGRFSTKTFTFEKSESPFALSVIMLWSLLQIIYLPQTRSSVQFPMLRFIGGRGQKNKKVEVAQSCMFWIHASLICTQNYHLQKHKSPGALNDSLSPLYLFRIASRKTPRCPEWDLGSFWQMELAEDKHLRVFVHQKALSLTAASPTLQLH